MAQKGDIHLNWKGFVNVQSDDDLTAMLQSEEETGEIYDSGWIVSHINRLSQIGTLSIKYGRNGSYNVILHCNTDQANPALLGYKCSVWDRLLNVAIFKCYLAYFNGIFIRHLKNATDQGVPEQTQTRP